MRSRAVLLSFSLGALALAAGCGGSDSECYDDRSCDTQQRCIIEKAGEVGTCGPCESTETPYNGIDDDCNDRTLDIDLDGDGENAVSSAFSPGLDCDDADPQVNSRADEVCGDAKDNDCDGEVDERDCADLSPPTVRFVSPMNGDTISGQAILEIEVNDDVGATTIVIQANNIEVGRVDVEPQQMRTEQVALSTVALSDGNIILKATAYDLKGQVASAVITVAIDNSTPPDIQIGAPIADVYYGGYLTATATITDPSGVARVEVELDGAATSTLTAAPWQMRVETSSLADGQHEILFRAFDTNNAVSSRRVQFLVDNQPPYIAFSGVSAGQIVSGTVQVTVTATDTAGVASLTAGGTTGASPISYAIDTSVMPNGPITLSASAVDTVIVDDGMAGGNVATASITVTVENIDPTPAVTFIRPMVGDGVLGATAIEVDAVSPVGASIAAVDFAIGGRLVGSVSTPPYLLTYDFSATATGTVGVTATAVDIDGNSASATVVVRKVATPNFRASPAVSTAGISAVAGLAVADLDRDGVQDVVVGSNQLLVFTGTVGADGGWRPMPSQSVTPAGLADVRIADVDGDQWPDVIGFAPGFLRIYTNDGAGTLALMHEYALPQANLGTFDVADLDGDQDLDVVVAGGNTPGIVGYVYVAQGDGSFVRGQDLGGDSGASDVTVADIDADGDADVIVGRSSTAVLTIFFNGGSGNFGAGQDTTTAGPMSDVAVAEMTGDTNLDIVIELVDGFQVMPVLNTSPFQLAAGPTVISGTPSGILTADVVGSSLTDVLVVDRTAHGVHVVENGVATPSGYQTSRDYVVATSFDHGLLADVDGDNALDILGVSGPDSSLVWARNIGGGEFLATETQRAPRLQVDPVTVVQLVPSSIGVGNVIGSAAADLIVNFDGATTHSPQLVMYERIGGQLLITGALVLAAGIDPPNLFEVGGASPTSGYAYMVAGTKTTATSMGVNTMTIIESLAPSFNSLNLTLDYMTDIKIADVDNDNGAEILIAFDDVGAAADGAVVVEPDLSGVRGPYNYGEGAYSIAAGDLDGDALSRTDFAVANTTSENIAVHLWNGAGFNSTLYNAPTGLGTIITGRVNGDNLVDLVGVAGNNQIFVMEGDAGFGFKSPVTYAGGTGATKIVGGDFNGDGRLDVMTLDTGDKMSLLLARPQGGFFPPLRFATGAGPVDMRTADFDGDGRPDIVFANRGRPSMSIMFNDADGL